MKKNLMYIDRPATVEHETIIKSRDIFTKLIKTVTNDKGEKIDKVIYVYPSLASYLPDYNYAKIPPKKLTMDKIPHGAVIFNTIQLDEKGYTLYFTTPEVDLNKVRENLK